MIPDEADEGAEDADWVGAEGESVFSSVLGLSDARPVTQ